MPSAFSKSSVFSGPHVHAKTAFSKRSTQVSVFEKFGVFINGFHRIRVDGSRVRKEKVGQVLVVWSGP